MFRQTDVRRSLQRVPEEPKDRDTGEGTEGRALMTSRGGRTISLTVAGESESTTWPRDGGLWRLVRRKRELLHDGGPTVVSRENGTKSLEIGEQLSAMLEELMSIGLRLSPGITAFLRIGLSTRELIGLQLDNDEPSGAQVDAEQVESLSRWHAPLLADEVDARVEDLKLGVERVADDLECVCLLRRWALEGGAFVVIAIHGILNVFLARREGAEFLVRRVACSDSDHARASGRIEAQDRKSAIRGPQKYFYAIMGVSIAASGLNIVIR
jgi:hypothetical protein